MNRTRPSSEEVPLLDQSASLPDLAEELDKTQHTNTAAPGAPRMAAERKPLPPEDLDDIHAEPVDDVPVLEAAGPLSKAGLSASRQPFVLGNYEFIRRIGIGGFGAVYLAHQKNLDREVALKLLSRSKAQRADFVERFKREARHAVRLDHPNIVRGYDLFEEKDDKGRMWHGFAMEYVPGENMQTWMRQLGRLSVGDALNVTVQVATALQYAHDLKLIHRDIKPENILIAPQGVAKLADLGLAKALDEDDLNLTGTGIGFGTPYYMAPEQARSAKTVDHRCDIYALGTSLYLFLTGKLPFEGESALELIQAKLNDPYRAIRKLNPDVPDKVDLVVAKMLQKRPQERYQSCADLLRDIERLGLTSRRLSFLRSESSSIPNQTQQISVEVKTPAKTDTTLAERTEEDSWFVRYRNSKGEEVTRQLTTQQLEDRIRDPRFDLRTSLVCRSSDGEYRPVVSFPEFQASFRTRLSLQAKARADRRAPKLQQAYDQIQSELDEKERQRQEDADSKDQPIKELIEHPAVSNVIGSVQRWWAENKPSVTPVPRSSGENPPANDSAEEQATNEKTSPKVLWIAIGLGVLAGLIFLRFLFYILGSLL